MRKTLAIRNQVFFKVIALFVIVLVFVSTLIAAFSVHYFQQTTHDMTALVRAQSVRAIELSVNSKLGEYSNLIYQIVLDDEVRELLAELRDESYDNLSFTVYRLQARLRHYSSLIPDVLAITVLDAHNRMISNDRTSQLSENNHGLLVEDHVSGALNSITDDAYFRRRITFIADDRHPSGKSMIHIAMPVWDYYSREDFGIILVTVDAASLWQVIGSGAADRLAKLFLVQEDGRFLVHPTYSMTGRPMTGYQLNLEAMEVLPLEPANGEEPVFPPGAELTVAPIGRYNLYLVSMIDPAMYNEATLRYTGYVVPLALVTALVSTMLCFIVLKGLLRSIRQIIAEIAKVRDGSLEARVEIEPRDEISHIADALNNMLEKLESVSDERDQEFLRYLRESERRRLAEARTLESQINSHFLYNTLNTISYSAIEDGSIKTSEMIRTLSDCLRYTLDKRQEVVCVRDEVEWIQRYLELQKERQPSLFTYDIRMSPETADLPIQKMLLQPFVENATLHGFAGCKRGKTVWIRVSRVKNPDRISISIRDDGVGIQPAKLEEIRNLFKNYESADGLGIGIENVCFRLKTQYKSNARIYIRSRPGCGTRINLLLPVNGKRSSRILDDGGAEDSKVP